MDLISGLIGLGALGGIGWSAKDTAAALRVSHKRTLSDYLPWRRLIRPSIVTTSADEYLTVFRFAARDVGTLSPVEVLEVARRLAAAIGSLKPKPSITLQFYAVRERAAEYLRPDAPMHPVLDAADEERERFFFEQEPGFETVRYLSLAWRPSDQDLAELRAAVFKNVDAAHAVEQRLLTEFESLVSRLASSLTDAFATVERLGEYSAVDPFGCERRRSKLLEFLHFFVTGTSSPFNVPEDSVIELNGLLASRGFTGRTATPKIGDDFVLPILLKTFPKEAELQILDELTQVGVEHYFAVRYLPLTLAEVQKETRDIVLDFQGQAKQHGSFVDPGAADSADEVAHAHGAAKNAYTQFGNCTFTVVIRAATLAALVAAKKRRARGPRESGIPQCVRPGTRGVGCHRRHVPGLVALDRRSQASRTRSWRRDASSASRARSRSPVQRQSLPHAEHSAAFLRCRSGTRSDPRSHRRRGCRARIRSRALELGQEHLSILPVADASSRGCRCPARRCSTKVLHHIVHA